jgi:hypothetical protein
MKHIPYIKKITTASTEYRQMLPTDVDWVLEQCKKLHEIASVCKKNGIREGDRLNTKNPKIPRMGTGGINTCSSICEGVIDNLNGSQYNLSAPQCDGLEEAFRIGEDLIEDFESVVFEQVDKLPKMTLPGIPDISGSTLGDLFDVDTIVVTYRKR